MSIYDKIHNMEFGDTFLKYFDFKEGFRESSFRKIKKNNYILYSNYFDLLLQIGKNEKNLKAILRKKFKKGYDNEIVVGLGATILGDVLSYLNTHKISSKDIIGYTYQIKEWNEISKRIWSIGCAVKPQRL